MNLWTEKSRFSWGTHDGHDGGVAAVLRQTKLSSGLQESPNPSPSPHSCSNCHLRKVSAGCRRPDLVVQEFASVPCQRGLPPLLECHAYTVVVPSPQFQEEASRAHILPGEARRLKVFCLDKRLERIGARIVGVVHAADGFRLRVGQRCEDLGTGVSEAETGCHTKILEADTALKQTVLMEFSRNHQHHHLQ